MILPDANAAQVNFIFTGVNLPSGAECTLGLDLTSYGGTIAALAVEVLDNWGDNIIPNQVNDVTLTGCLIKRGPNATGPSLLSATSRVGGLVDNAVAPNTAFLVHKNTAMGGRSGRGRMYVPGVPEAACGDNGVLTAGTVTNWTTALNTFVTRMNAFLVDLSLLHNEGAPITTPTEITSLTIDSLVATQRRRLRR